MKRSSIIAVPVCSVLMLFSGTLMAETELSRQDNDGLRVDASPEYLASDQRNARLRPGEEASLAGRDRAEDTWKFSLVRIHALDRHWNINLQYRILDEPGNFRLYRPVQRQVGLAAEFRF